METVRTLPVRRRAGHGHAGASCGTQSRRSLDRQTLQQRAFDSYRGVALGAVDREQHRDLITGGIQWLARHQNADGGWGDTVKSRSNISTTALCWAALSGAAQATEFTSSIAHAETWLTRAAGSMAELVPRHRAPYGKDRTFSVPILMHLAICGRVSWRQVPALPFELAGIAASVFRRAAIARRELRAARPHRHRPGNPSPRAVRQSPGPLDSRVAQVRTFAGARIDPAGKRRLPRGDSVDQFRHHGPGLRRPRAASRGAARRPLPAGERAGDGSWAIDTDLATWVTTLAIKALAHQPGALTPEQQLTLREWLLGQQYRQEHPYTHAAPGGWAWTDLPGGVPDADDTPGALLALLHLGAVDAPTRAARTDGGAPGCSACKPRRRYPHLLPRLGRAALRPQFTRSHRAHPARLDRLAPAT
ncbi:MAG: hypothetical protein WDN28_31400 [Chthoniobacter sp.]